MKENIDQLALAGHEIIRRPRGNKPMRSPGRPCAKDRSVPNLADSRGKQALGRKEIAHWFLAMALCFAGVFVLVAYAPVVGAKLMYAVKLYYEDPYNLKR